MTMINSEFTAVILAATAGSRLYPLTISADDEMDDYFDMNDDDDNVDDNNTKNNNNNNSDGLSSTQTKTKNPGSDNTVNGNDSEITYLPKHLLPLAGRPLIHHLIDKLTLAHLNDVVIVIAQEDEVTISSLMEMKGAKLQKNETQQQGKNFIQIMHIGNSCLKIVKLQSECNGSADALRFIMSTSIKTQQQKEDDNDNNEHNEAPVIPHDNHVLVLPGDLVLYGNLTGTSERDADGDTLRSLVDEHRRHYRLSVRGDGPPLALTLVLADVGETDENGAPLKESAKVRYVQQSTTYNSLF